MKLKPRPRLPPTFAAMRGRGAGGKSSPKTTISYGQLAANIGRPGSGLARWGVRRI